ncbi:Uncharacterized protein TCM_039428 [Theobroma cacao]|uniref:Uncharacterized protein n=1 Tax=Theobroma cacao TaxID=3641 RepID=A0A061GR77_THECC|nr:Uncharacterized protein TCM_039428 [Theobroma cacao]
MIRSERERIYLFTFAELRSFHADLSFKARKEEEKERARKRSKGWRKESVQGSEDDGGVVDKLLPRDIRAQAVGGVVPVK